MPNLLVSLVGLNPASSLISARALQPDRAVLIHTKESELPAQALSAQLSCPSKRVAWSPRPGIDEARGRVVEDLALRNEKVALDLTGGTKLMSLGAWQGLTDRLGDALEALYVDQRNLELVDARTGRRWRGGHVRAEIRPEEVLARYGAHLRRTEWQGRLSEIPRGVRRRRDLAEHLFRAFGRSGSRVRPMPDGGLAIERRLLPGELPEGSRCARRRLYSSSPVYLGANTWLEELCLAAAADAAGDRASEVLAAHGMVVHAGGGEDEMDVVLTRGPRTLVIEAKARGSRAGAGADVQKRIQKARRFFGSHVVVIVVIPAWGAEPPRDLRDLTHDHAVLVGADEEALGDEIRRGFGL